MSDSYTGMVIIGDSSPLERLRPVLDSVRHSGIELMTPEPLLVPYDMGTQDGEARRRELEHAYAGLRNKVLVRLLVANLNPEQVRREPEPPLARIRREWTEMRRRMRDLLNEGDLEGVALVSILVTEEGEWTSLQRDDLRLLSSVTAPSASPEPVIRSKSGLRRHPNEKNEIAETSGDVAQTPPHRCYLMTRVLELGRDEVCHARDAWPRIVAGLLEYLNRARQLERGMTQFGSTGLYAWRTVRFVAGVDPSELEEQVRRAILAANRLLLAPSDSPLFAPLSPEAQPGIGEKFSDPAEIGTAVQKIDNPEWLAVGMHLLEGIVAPAPWVQATRDFARGSRSAAWHARNTGSGSFDFEPGPDALGIAGLNDPATDDIDAVRARVESGRAVPGKMFPGSLPEAIGLADWTDLTKIRQKIEQAAASRKVLEDRWREYDHAVRAFATMPERAAIGFAVGAALFYWVFLVVLGASQALTEASAGDWIAAAWVSLWGLSGVATMLLLGHVLQRWRGMKALTGDARAENSRGTIAHSVAEYLEAERDVRTELGRALKHATAVSVRWRRISVRRVLHHRLCRVESVLQNELQPLPQNGSRPFLDPVLEGQDRALRRILEVDLGVPGSAVQHEDLGNDLIEKVERSFRDEWHSLLDKVDIQRIGFLPSGDLLRLCLDHTARLRAAVLASLQNQVISDLRLRTDEGRTGAEHAFQAAKMTAEIGSGRARFFSVDLRDAPAPQQRLWVAREFEQDARKIFGTLTDGHIRPIEGDLLGAGVLGFWHGDLPLDFSADNPDGTIRFVAKSPGRAAR